MEIIELARRMAALGQKEEARKAYALVVSESRNPAETLEAALWLLENGEDYRVPYSAFLRLFRAGHYQTEILRVMTRAFYEPNVRELEKRYRKNCRVLRDYPYLFRKDFLPFEDAPLVFFPYGRDAYMPFDTREARFMEYVNTKTPIVSRSFFRNLENPILAEGVFSQYELEYLRDNVRPSEYVGKDNHIYLSYPDWEVFCSWLQVLDWKPLLVGKKFVFLIGADVARYPIDFQKEFGVDYSRDRPRPVGIREVNKLICHTQLSAHNGGDFFNEIFDAHPNLIGRHSISIEALSDEIAKLRAVLSSDAGREKLLHSEIWDSDAVQSLLAIRNPTDKDLMVALFMSRRDRTKFLDPNSRIAPAIFFQPHFYNIMFSLKLSESGEVSLESEQMDKMRDFRPFQEFRYIKTFTPMRRFTTSYAATLRFMSLVCTLTVEGRNSVIYDVMSQRVLNRTFMRDPDERLFRDGVIVRFEDGKLNPKATFTRLADFLDIPYAESMTYCSEMGIRDPVTLGNVVGFDPATVFRTYDEFINDKEGAYLEYFLRDAYAFYGYDFHYYDGAPVDEARARDWVENFSVLNYWIRWTWEQAERNSELARNGTALPQESVSEETAASLRKQSADRRVSSVQEDCLRNTSILLRDFRFVSKNGKPLEMTPLLEPDPALLETPPYR